MKSKPTAWKDPWKWMAIAAAAVLLAGCAVLTVDVDVYKGPLANEESVQVEQLCAMAMGAKPLLIALRDEAECNWNDAKAKQVRIDKNPYKPGYMDHGFKNPVTIFTNDIALRVNAVLSLYEDRGLTTLAPELAKARMLLKNYQIGYEEFRRTYSEPERAQMAARWGLSDPSKSENKAALWDLIAPQGTNAAGKDGWRDEIGLFQLLGSNRTVWPSDWKNFVTKTNEFPAKSFGASSGRFALLTNSLFVSNVVVQLLLPAARIEERAALSNDLFSAGQSFQAAHHDLEELWLHSLRLLETVYSQSQTDGTRRGIEWPLRVARSFVGMGLHHERFMAVYVAGASANSPQSFQGLRKLIDANDGVKKLLPPPAEATHGNRDRQKANIREALEKLLTEKPIQTVNLLRLAHLDYKAMSIDEFATVFRNQIGSQDEIGRLVEDKRLPVNRAFGLARSVPRYEPRSEDIERIQRGLGEMSQGAFGFAHGRVEDGLQRLIESYLKAKFDAAGSTASTTVRAKREQMLLGLTGFAEKIKFVADNDILAKGGSPAVTDSSKSRPYVMLLQSTGNSILSLIDELRQREKKPQRAGNSAEVQQKAVGSARTILATLPPVIGDTNSGPTIERLHAVANLLTFTGQAAQSVNALTNLNAGLLSEVQALTGKVSHVATHAVELRKLSEARSNPEFTNAPATLRTNVTNLVAAAGPFPEVVRSLLATSIALTNALRETTNTLLRTNAYSLVTNLSALTIHAGNFTQTMSTVQAGNSAVSNLSQTYSLVAVKERAAWTHGRLTSGTELLTQLQTNVTGLHLALAQLTNVAGPPFTEATTNNVAFVGTHLTTLSNSLSTLTNLAWLLKETNVLAESVVLEAWRAALGKRANEGVTDANAVLAGAGSALGLLERSAKETNSLQDGGQAMIRVAQALPDPEGLTGQAAGILTGTKARLVPAMDSVTLAFQGIKTQATAYSASATTISAQAPTTLLVQSTILLPLAEITKAQDAIAKQLNAASAGITNTLPSVLGELLEQAKAIQAATKKTETVVKEMKGFTPVVVSSLRTNFLTSVGGTSNSLSALDTLLEQMRLMHIASVASGEIALAENLKGAIEQARNYRADQVFIRPPSAYLRNSYATSATQDGTDTSWKNKLLEHGLKSIPMLPEIFHYDADGKIRREIDKQYWQNINKVKVSAAVTADYVIVKDDIGNWYVKGFSADSESMIKAARALGLYAGGASLANGILSKTTNAAGQVSLNTTTNLLDRQRSAFDTNYRVSSSNQLADVTALIAGLKASVTSNWGNDTNLTGKVESLTQRWDKLANKHSLLSTNSGKTSDNDQILACLAKLRSFRDDLKANLNNTGSEGLNLNEPQRNAATEGAIAHIDAQANEFITRRLETVREYETALRVLGTSASNQ